MMALNSRHWLALGAVLAASLPYFRSLDDYFLQDDFGVIQLLSSRPWTTFPMWFVMPWTENIFGYTPDEVRPFVALTYQLSAIPGAGRPELHHIFNIGIHAANALLVMAIARVGIGVSVLASAYAGVVFAVLPMHAESVAYIIGRVDSMPAFFYLLTVYTYILWRNGSEPGTGPQSVRHAPMFSKSWDLIALGSFFIALFSKQNTITLVATLASYDLLMMNRMRRGSIVSCVKAWLPFAIMTLGYLAYRKALMGESVRGGIQSWDQLSAPLRMIGRHGVRTISGQPLHPGTWEYVAAVGILTIVVIIVLHSRRFIRPALCFGAAWWVICSAPVLLAGYESPRHVYLASAAWAFLLGLFMEALSTLPRTRSPLLRAAPLVLGTLVVGAYLVRLNIEVRRWGRSSEVSKAAVARVAQEVSAASEGTLILVGVPNHSWSWAVPFVLQPPYAPVDLSRRVDLITPFRLHCCAGQWNNDTRARLERWQNASTASPAVALNIATTGVVSKQTESPELVAALIALRQTTSREALDAGILEILRVISGDIPSGRLP